MIEDGVNPDASPSGDLPGHVLPEAVRATPGMT